MKGVPVVRDRHVPGVRVLRVVAGDGAQGYGGVFHRPGDGTHLVHGPRTGRDTEAADPAPTGPETDDAAPSSRAADRAAGVLTQGCGAQEGGGGRTGAAAGAPGKTVQVPRVAVEAVALRSPQGELGEVGLAQDYGPRLLQIRHGRGVFVREEVGHEPGTDGGPDALGPNLVLEGYRDAVHRTQVFAAGDGTLGFMRSRHGLLSGDGQVRVELEVQGVNAVEVRRGGLDRRNFAGANQVREFRRGQKRNVLLVHL